MLGYGEIQYIAIPRIKTAFIEVPKVGSTSLSAIALAINNSNKYFYSISAEEIWEESDNRSLRQSSIPDDYNIIMFVRNPFERVYSSFCHVAKPHRNKYLHRYLDRFNDFVSIYLAKSCIENHHFYPSLSLFTNILERTMVYRFEDFSSVLKDKLNIEEVPHIHYSDNKRKYQEVYNLKSKLIVSKLYEWDLKNLKYNFGGISGELPSTGELINSAKNNT